MDVDSNSHARETSALFEREFSALMTRLHARCRESVSNTDIESRRAECRRVIADEFAHEIEDLIRRHSLGENLATYVRHVVRLGFEADFDPMDPHRVEPE